MNTHGNRLFLLLAVSCYSQVNSFLHFTVTRLISVELELKVTFAIRCRIELTKFNCFVCNIEPLSRPLVI